MGSILEQIDENLFRYLLRNPETVPSRFVKFLAYYYPDARIRKVYLDRLGVKLGVNSYTNLGFQCALLDQEVSAVIGNNVSIAPNVTLVCNSSANNGVEINRIPYVKENLTKSAQIVIEDDVWIGANVTILPGIRVGKCSVLAASSVIIRDVESYSIYAGVPARRIRDLISGERV